MRKKNGDLGVETPEESCDCKRFPFLQICGFENIYLSYCDKHIYQIQLNYLHSVRQI